MLRTALAKRFCLALAVALMLGSPLHSAWAGHPSLPGRSLDFSPPPANPLALSFSHGFGDDAIRIEQSLHRVSGGKQVRFARLAYLLSEFRLIDQAGKEIVLPEQYLYVNAGEGRLSGVLHGVPAGRYRALCFTVGLNDAVNHGDPARYSPDHALHPLLNRLHWGWQGGYVFLALEGYTLVDGTPREGLLYHIGGGGPRMAVRVPLALDYPSQAAAVLRLDLKPLFVGDAALNLSTERSTHARPGDGTAQRVRGHMRQAFSARAGVATQAATPVRTTVRSAAAGSPYPWPQPAHFPVPRLPADNPLTVEGVALGARLFHERALSARGNQSCATCHQAVHAFTDPGKAFSRGTAGTPGVRNTMPLFNLAWSDSFAWDGRHRLLREQALAPISDVKEMHLPLAEAATRLARDTGYRKAFADAFGDPEVTASRIGLALEQYLLTLISSDSRFDRHLRGQATLTAEELRGMALFMTENDPERGQRGADCFHCHGGNLFTTHELKNNGLAPRGEDRGRSEVSGLAADRDRFKTPSLRNVALTAPYMHDGRFTTLEEVVEHYNTGVRMSETLDPSLAKHAGRSLNLSDADKAALVAFMKTLTDSRFQTVPRASTRPTSTALLRTAP